MTTLYSPSAHAFYFPDDKNAPADSFLVSDADHMAAVNLPQGSSFSFAAPGSPENIGALSVTLPTAEEIAAQVSASAWSAYQAQASATLMASDRTVMRCYEAGIALPAEWSAYRKALRAITGATSGTAGALPVAPAYPAGT